MARGRRARRRGLLAALVGILAAATTMTLTTTAGADEDSERCVRHRETAAERARLVTGHGDRVAVIGDSYAVGLGVPARRSWPTRLVGRVDVDGFSGSGFSRDASPCGEVSFVGRAPGVVREDVGLVVVQGGLNDFDQPDAAIEAGFTRLLDVLGDRRVVVVGPPLAPARAHAVPRIDALLAGLAARHEATYVSMTTHDFPYLPDGLHLTAEGHRMFGDVVAEHVAGLG